MLQGDPENVSVTAMADPAAMPAIAMEEVETAAKALLPTVDVSGMSLKEFREALCEHCGLPPNSLDFRKDEVNDLVKRLLNPETCHNPAAKIVKELGPEKADHRGWVYLATVSRVLEQTRESNQDLCEIALLSREDIAVKFRDAFDNPLRAGKGGRPSGTTGIVKYLVVVQEEHEGGEVHFHVALKLNTQRQFLPVKKTLRTRHRLAVHFSCSHTQFWSALRYCIIPTLQKPKVDETPYAWSSDGAPLDLYELSQRPWMAAVWKRHREDAEKEASAAGKRARFTKLDLTAIILAKQLRSKHEVLEYAQNFGCQSMQQFVSNKQRQLSEFLQDAWEWNSAPAEAAKDRQSGWEVVCALSAKQCPFGADCGYAAAATRIFDANSDTLRKDHLATCLRDIILTGPSKTTRTPLLAGATNTGKTTLVLPFDQVFGPDRVFRKPALGSKFALRNILRHKRFLLWDDYRPVEFAQCTVQVSTFLSLFTGQPFEVQVSQSFTDGNIDFKWQQGCVLTAKAEGLWQPLGCVSQEDIRHMQSRVTVFPINSQVPNLRDIDPCPVCLCKWVTSGAAAHDAAIVLQSPLQVAPPTLAGTLLPGLADMNKIAKLRPDHLQELSAALLAQGACHVDEVTVQDWKELGPFASLGLFEQRRLLAAVQRRVQ